MLARSRRGIAGAAGRFTSSRASSAGFHGSQFRLSTGGPLVALLGARQSPAVLARSGRQFSASSSKASDAPYEALKADFGRWLRGELGLLAVMLVVGVGGVYFYQVGFPHISILHAYNGCSGR